MEQGKNDISKLMFAASRGDLAEARRLLESGEKINAVDTFGNTALMYATKGGYADVVEFLLGMGASPYIKDKLDHDCLQSAESRGHTKVVGLLRGAQLLLSIREGEVERIIELLDAGVDVNFQLTDGWTPLMVAALDNQIEMAKVLLSRGASINHQNSKGLTPEMIASRKGHWKIVELLQSARAVTQSVIQTQQIESDILELEDDPLDAATVGESKALDKESAV